MIALALIVVAFLFQIAAASRQIRVTCIGDSITQGTLGCTPDAYVDILAKQLGPQYSVMNAGVSGRTMMKKGVLDGSMQPFSYWDTTTWQSALTSNPDIVTIMLGTNDAKFYNWEGIQQGTGDYYALDYVDMINRLKKETKAKEIFVMVPPPLRAPYPFDMNQTVINEIFPVLVRNIAVVTGVKVIDIFTALSDKDYSCDGCHPTHDGNVAIANTMFESIKKFHVDN